MFPGIASAALYAAAPLAAQVGFVAETANFRIVAGPDAQLERDAVVAAAVHLENVRSRLAATGLTPRLQADEPLNILLTPTIVSMQSLTGGFSGPQTRGLTVHGVDRNLVLLAWHAPGNPFAALAHEYAHQLDDSAWPLWFVEGRAEFLARYPSRAARGHLIRLERSERIGLQVLLTAEKGGGAASASAFYAEAWLVFAWLAERRGGSIAGIRPAHIYDAIDELGTDAVETELRQYAESLGTALRGKQPVVEILEIKVKSRGMKPWESSLLEVEINLALGRRQRASNSLAVLVRKHPNVARIHAVRGLAAIAAKDYDRAESSLARAIEIGDLRAATAYRYTLMLMRPGSDAVQRAAEALKHSLRARDRVPGEPRYQLAVAQARMLTGHWERAFEDLNRLAAFPDWTGRAAREAAEVRRRRGRLLAAETPPPLAPQAVPSVNDWPQAPDIEPLPVPPPRPQKPAAGSSWPPPGTTLAYGRIGWVDCSGRERKIVLSTPRLRLVLRENPKSPPRLLFPPVKWEALPCGTYGWTVNIAYKPLRDSGEVKGEAAAILF